MAARRVPTTMRSTQPQRPAARPHVKAAAGRAEPGAPPKLSASASRTDEALLGPGLGDDTAGANIKVVVRCRGLGAAEKEAKGVLQTEGMRGSVLTVTVGEERDGRAFPLGPNIESKDKSPNTKTYPFDHVFGPEADQALIYNDVVAPIVKEVIGGYNCTIFAYGQTGTGKTYTMSGDLSVPASATSLDIAVPGSSRPSAAFIPAAMAYAPEAGIIPRALHQLFALLDNDDAEYAVRVSFVELYNEELRDLNAIGELPPPVGRQTGSMRPASAEPADALKIFDDAKRGTFIQGLEETPISSAADGIRVLTRGSARRQMAATRCNDQSSRSHSIFTITVHVREPAEGTSSTKSGKSSAADDLLKVGKLNLVDLAGSENVGRSGAGKEGGRAREAGMINQSLLALGRVINALVEKNGHVPYRESKLTRLLQDSLGGRTKTCIIATVSPSRVNLEETLSTLDYAVCAKSIRNRPELNARMTKHALINQYVQELERLKLDLIAARERNGIWLSPESWQDLSSEHEARKVSLDDARRQVEVYEHHVATARESLEQSLRLLGLRDQEMKRISEELSSTSASLQATEARARNLGEQWREEQAMRQAFEDSRSAWKDWAQLAYADAEGLRAKIERKAAVETANLQTVSQAAGAFAAMTRELEAQLLAFSDAHAERSMRVQRTLHEFTAVQFAELAAHREYLLDRFDGLVAKEEACRDASARIEGCAREYASSNATSQSTVARSAAAASALLLEHQQRQKLGLDKYLAHVQEESSKLDTFVASTLHAFVAESHRVAAEEGARLAREAEAERQMLATENEALRQRVAHLEAALNAEQQRDEDDEKALLEVVRAQRVARAQRRGEAASQWRALLEQRHEAEEARAASRLEGLEQSHFGSVARVRDIEALSAVLTDTSSRHEKAMETYTRTAAESSTAEDAAFLGAWSGHRDGITDAANVIGDWTERFSTEMGAACADGAGHLAELFGNTRDTYSALRTELECMREGIETTVQSVSEDCSTQQMSTDAFQAAASAHVSNLVRDVQTYLSSEMREDVSTGKTPRRRPILEEALDLDTSQRTNLLTALLTVEPADGDVSTGPRAASRPRDPSPAAAGLVAASAAVMAVTPVKTKEGAKGGKTAPPRRSGILREKLVNT